MQLIELLGVLFLGAVAMLVALPIAAERCPAPRNALGIGIGIGAGLVGAVVVLVISTDLVPDDIEDVGRAPLIVLVVAIGAVIAVFIAVRQGTRR
jgi:hypothetical protein